MTPSTKIPRPIRVLGCLLTAFTATVFAGTAGAADSATANAAVPPPMEMTTTLAKQSQETLATAKAFMAAFGSGDTAAMTALMADDMVWHNEGDKSVPWIGPWNGKSNVLKFFSAFRAGFQTVAWNTEDGFAHGDTAAFFGTMNGKVTKTGKTTGTFTFALRVKVKDGKVALWNWFEDSLAVSRAYQP